MLPSVFGSCALDDWMDFPFANWDRDWFPEVNREWKDLAKPMMRSDVKEYEDHFEIEMDLPGYQKDEIKATLKKGYLTVTASKETVKEEDSSKEEASENADAEAKTETPKVKYLRRERYQGNMSRSFYVGEHLTQEDITAKFEEGILHVNVPKKSPEEVEKIDSIAIG